MRGEVFAISCVRASREFFQIAKDFIHLLNGILLWAIGVYDVLGVFLLLWKWHLPAQSCRHFFARQVVTFHPTSNLGLRIAGHQDHPIERGISARFYKNSGLDYRYAVRVLHLPRV